MLFSSGVAEGARIVKRSAVRGPSVPHEKRIGYMSNSQRVAIITGASQGIGEGLVTAYRKLGYAVVANSRTIVQSDDPMVETVPGDIAQPGS